MRSSKTTCDRCGVEASEKEDVKVATYVATTGWYGHSCCMDFRWDLCEKCRVVVDTAFLGVANSIVINKETTTDGN